MNDLMGIEIVCLEWGKLVLTPLKNRSERAFKKSEIEKNIAEGSGDRYLIESAKQKCRRKMFIYHTYETELNRIESKLQNAN